jgi:excisionase family DNA binding protein
MDDGDRLMSVAEAGDYLGTGERFVRHLIAQRRMRYYKIGGRYVRIKKIDLDGFIEDGRVDPDDE